MSATNLLVADNDTFCGKHGKFRSEDRFRQAGRNQFNRTTYKSAAAGVLMDGLGNVYWADRLPW